MWFFDLWKRKKNTEEQSLNCCNTEEKLASRYLVKNTDIDIPLSAPERNYKILDTITQDIFELSIIYSEYDVSDLPRKYYNPDEDYCSVTVYVKHLQQRSYQDYSCSFSATLYQKDFNEIIGFRDVDLALYHQLKQARQDSSNPERQDDAYLVSTLLRATHDNIWIAPLLINKNRWDRTTPELEKIKEDVIKTKEKAQSKIKKYKEKESPVANLRQVKSQYVKSLIKENFVEGI